MAVTVFTWDMFKIGPHFGVGHAAMHVHGPQGNVYISFWPAEHSLSKAMLSTGKIHFMRGDKEEDGMPSWASAPITNLDEGRIVDFWKAFDLSPSLDYRGAGSRNVTKPNEGGKKYNILLYQCSTTVVRALWHGADEALRRRIETWLAVNAGTNFDVPLIGAVKSSIFGARIPTVTPADVREMVCYIWGGE